MENGVHENLRDFAFFPQHSNALVFQDPVNGYEYFNIRLFTPLRRMEHSGATLCLPSS